MNFLDCNYKLYEVFLSVNTSYQFESVMSLSDYGFE